MKLQLLYEETHAQVVQMFPEMEYHLRENITKQVMDLQEAMATLCDGEEEDLRPLTLCQVYLDGIKKKLLEAMGKEAP